MKTKLLSIFVLLFGSSTLLAAPELSPSRTWSCEVYCADPFISDNDHSHFGEGPTAAQALSQAMKCRSNYYIRFAVTDRPLKDQKYPTIKNSCVRN